MFNHEFCFIDIVYIETLLYIVHVDDIDLVADEVTEEMYDGGDEQQSALSNKLIRRVSKRTTASFNERHHCREDQTMKVPIYTRPSFGFSNPLRRLNSNSNLKTIVYSFLFFRFT